MRFMTKGGAEMMWFEVYFLALIAEGIFLATIVATKLSEIRDELSKIRSIKKKEAENGNSKQVFFK